MENKYKVTYKQKIYTKNTTIQNRGFSCISFENIGKDNAVINDIIPLNNVGIARAFNEKPNVNIDNDFTIMFAGLDNDKKILVIESYYSKI